MSTEGRQGSTVEVCFCGTADAFCSGGHLQASYVVRGPRSTLLLDCGATLLSSLKRHAIAPDEIEIVAISHLHGDHFGGLPFLLLEFLYRTPRTRPLTVCGPPGTAERVPALFAALYRDVGTRPLPFPLRYVELLPDQEVALPDGLLRAFRVPHQEREVSLGYRVEVEGRSIVYSGDTGWTEALIDVSAGSDLFICECSFFATRVDNHLDYRRLADHAHRFATRRLVLTHLGEEVLQRRSAMELELAFDGLRVALA